MTTVRWILLGLFLPFFAQAQNSISGLGAPSGTIVNQLLTIDVTIDSNAASNGIPVMLSPTGGPTLTFQPSGPSCTVLGPNDFSCTPANLTGPSTDTFFFIVTPTIPGTADFDVIVGACGTGPCSQPLSVIIDPPPPQSELSNVSFPVSPPAGQTMTIDVSVESTSSPGGIALDISQMPGAPSQLSFQAVGVACTPMGPPNNFSCLSSNPTGPANDTFSFTTTPLAGSYDLLVISPFCSVPTPPNACALSTQFTATSPAPVTPPPAVIPSITISLSDTVSETAGQVTVDINLSEASSSDISFQISTSDGTATAGQDYSAMSQTINWTAGDASSRSLSIPIIDDQEFEGNENFSISISSVSSGATLGSASSYTVTITDDEQEPAGEIEFTQTDYQVDENTGALVLTVSRKSGFNGAVSVEYASSDGSASAASDYLASTGTLNWEAGDSADKEITVDILKDSLQELSENFTISLSQASNGAKLGSNITSTINISDISNPDAPVVTLGADIEASDFDGDGFAEVKLDASASISKGSEIKKVEWLLDDELIASGLTTTATLPVGNNQVLARISNTADLVSEKILNVIISAQQAADTVKLASTAGIDRNEQSLAQTMDGICPRLAEANQLTPLTGASRKLLTRCEMLTNPDVSDADRAMALDAIAGEEVTAIINTATNFANVQQNNVRTRLSQLRLNRNNNKSLVDSSGLRIQLDGGTINGNLIAEAIGKALGGAAGADDDNYLIQSSRFGVFVNGSVLYGDKDKTDRQAGYDLEVKGLTVGMDYRITNNLVAGLALGYSDTSLDYNNSGGNMAADSAFYTAYGSYYNDNNFYVDASVTRGQADYDMRRRVAYNDAAGLFEQNIQSSTDGRQLLGTLDVGYDYVRGALIIGPNAGLSYSKTNIDAFAEQGQSGLELDFSRQESSAHNMNIGMHSSYTFLRDWGVLIAQFSGNYYKDFKNDANQVFANFVHNPFEQVGDTSISQMVIRTDAIDKSYMTFNLGLSAQFQHGLSGFVDYRYLAGARNVSSGEVSFGMRYELKF